MQAKICTIEKVLTTLEVIFTREGTLSQHGVRLASQLAKLLTHRSVQVSSSSRERDDSNSRERDGSSSGERDGSSSGEGDNSSLALERLILTHWKL